MSELYLWTLVIVGSLAFISSIDDLFIDLMTFLKTRRSYMPERATDPEKLAEPPLIAVFVANWHEADVLGQMVEKNIANITYRPLVFVLGVYPNDTETLEVASELEKKHPDLVRVVVNRRDGPTCKGQMLNEMFAVFFAESSTAPDLVVLHDSEDIIDPRSFAVYAANAGDCALVQIPVFSLDSRQRSMVAATYMEEFAERHSREMRVRCAVGSFVPSAGVGTSLRKDLILHFLEMRGYVLQPGSVTEDYILGAEAHREGFRSTFAFVRSASSRGLTTVATFEYFPKSFWASVRQKSRWVYGTVFDGTSRLGWSGGAWDRFFFYRDRKGAITNFLPALSLLLLFVGVLLGDYGKLLSPALAPVVAAILIANMVAVPFRLYFKIAALRETYGIYDIGGLLLRWPLAVTINAVATFRAWRSFIVESRFASHPIAWVKTQHELPAVFEPMLGLPARPRAVSLTSAASFSFSILTVMLLSGYMLSAAILEPIRMRKNSITPAAPNGVRQASEPGHSTREAESLAAAPQTGEVLLQQVTEGRAMTAEVKTRVHQGAVAREKAIPHQPETIPTPQQTDVGPTSVDSVHSNAATAKLLTTKPAGQQASEEPQIASASSTRDSPAFTSASQTRSNAAAGKRRPRAEGAGDRRRNLRGPGTRSLTRLSEAAPKFRHINFGAHP